MNIWALSYQSLLAVFLAAAVVFCWTLEPGDALSIKHLPALIKRRWRKCVLFGLGLTSIIFLAGGWFVSTPAATQEALLSMLKQYHLPELLLLVGSIVYATLIIGRCGAFLDWVIVLSATVLAVGFWRLTQLDTTATASQPIQAPAASGKSICAASPASGKAMTDTSK